MISKYTETFETYLANTQSENEWKALFERFPSFTLVSGLNLNMWDVFKRKYDIREIGAETEQLFAHYLRETIDEMAIKYIPKIQTFVDNFNRLFEFTVKLTYEQSENRGNTNRYYLNPVSTDIEHLKVQDVDTADDTMERTIERDVLQSVWGKTRANLLDQIMQLQSIYYDCVLGFEKCFMGIY